MIETIKQCVLSLATGLACGCVFAVLSLPVPAPNVLPGIVGIFGLYLGYTLVVYIRTGK